MPVAPNQSALKRRIDRYLWSNDSSETAILNSALSRHFRYFDRVAIIGGLVRDFAREGRSGFHSDVDLVINGPAEEVSRLAAKLNAVPNRFGGFGYRDGPWKIDFWALENSWARRHVEIFSFNDLLSATFFDWDAVAYDLWDRKLICPKDYLSRIGQRTLEINLRENPSPMGNLVRAVRRLVLWAVEPGPRLKDFIEEYLDDSSLRFIQAKELELFSEQVSCRWSTAREAKEFLFLPPPKRDHDQLEILLSRDD